LRRIPTLFLCAAIFLLQSCAQESQPTPSPSAPTIRVLILEDVPRAQISSQSSVQLWQDTSPTPTYVRLTSPTILTRQNNSWLLNSTPVTCNILTLQSPTNQLTINNIPYHGYFRFIPTGPTTFHAVNVLSIDDYLQGVISCEMYHDWPLEAYKAQAVASRTYALYEAKTAGLGRPFDVFADQRSQVYGAIPRETQSSRYAAYETAGVVLTYGPGDGKIFKAYFSSCCGGVSQANVDAFPGESFLPPLAEQYRGSCCSASKFFNWGPITIPKSTLTRRLQIWAQRQSQSTGKPLPESTISEISTIQVQSSNRYGRPTRILITDERGIQYSLSAEDMRDAVNTDSTPTTTLPSSFCKINGDPNLQTVTFYDGHGHGHGVGMCQWCAQAQAAAGQSAQQILLASYPGAKLIRAY
jgi:stage II sporulation protein D